MGALFVKAGCVPCFDRDIRKVSPELLCELPLQERRLSAEIIKELKTCGIIATGTTRARGGLSFDIVPNGDKMPRKPRRLPSLSGNKVQPILSKVAKDSRERVKNAGIRRQEILDKKAKSGKDYEFKRMTVLERRERKLKDKIRRTEERLRKTTVGGSK